MFNTIFFNCFINTFVFIQDKLKNNFIVTRFNEFLYFSFPDK